MTRLAALLALLATPATAQTCLPYAVAQFMLLEDHGETINGQGLDNAGNLVQLYVSTDGTWTVLIIPPGSPIGCIGGSGTDWQGMAQDGPA